MMDMHGVEFAALDTLQHRLARHAEDSSRASCIGTYPRRRLFDEAGGVEFVSRGYVTVHS